MGVSCAGLRAGRDDPRGSLPARNILRTPARKTHRERREGAGERRRSSTTSLFPPPLTHTYIRAAQRGPPTPARGLSRRERGNPARVPTQQKGRGRRQAPPTPPGPGPDGSPRPAERQRGDSARGAETRTRHPLAPTGSHQDPPRATAPSSPSSSSPLPSPPLSPRVLCGRRLFPQRYLL